MPLYSHSRLGSFEKCPLQYRYRYIDRIRREVKGIEAYMGNLVHQVLEGLYTEVADGKCPPVDALVGRYHERWDATYSDRIRIVKKKFTADHYRAIGERCIRNYYRSHDPFDDGVTLGLEQRVQISLDGSKRYQVQGFIDRLSRVETGVYAIHDYKTSSRLPSDGDLRQDRQLTFYEMGVRERYPDAREVRLIWHYVAFDQDLVSSRTTAELDEHRRKAILLIDTIEAATEHPPHESALCRWCDYRDICPAQAEQFRAEEKAAGRDPLPRSAHASAGDAGHRPPVQASVDPLDEPAKSKPQPEPSGPMRQLDLFS